MDLSGDVSGVKNLNLAYRGRFAPSPTGKLHLGSLFTAVASYLRAKSRNGQWLLRIDDLDGTRARSESIDSILIDLEKMGLCWDESVYYQSQHLQDYERALNILRQRENIYPCICSRSDIQNLSTDGLKYPGTCRTKNISSSELQALRIQVPNVTIRFKDLLHGPFEQNLSLDIGDFVLRRRDGFYAYQLAVVVDDRLQHITEVVRGSDLLDNTPRQIWLQQLLGYTTPDYLHIPLLMKNNKNKISKSTSETLLDLNSPRQLAIKILRLLNQPISADLEEGTLEEIWREATLHFDINRLPQSPITIPS